MKTNGPDGLFTFTDEDPNSNPISVVDNWDWNLKQTLYNVKSSTNYNIAIWFTVRIRIGIGIRIRQCKSAVTSVYNLRIYTNLSIQMSTLNFNLSGWKSTCYCE